MTSQINDVPSPEEIALQEEVTKLKEEIKKARDAVADVHFVAATEPLAELGRLRFKVRKQLRSHLAKITDLHWAKDSRHLLSASQDGRLFVWETHSCNKLHAITLKTAWVMGASLSPSENLVASGGLDNLCTIFNLKKTDDISKPQRELNGHDGYVAKVKFIDENHVLTCSGDTTSALWDIEKGMMITRFRGHVNDVNALALNKDFNGFVTASSDHCARLWDLRNPNHVSCFEGHQLDVNGVDFFPNNQLAFCTSSDDGTCRLWDIRADQALTVYDDEFIKCGSTSLAVSNSGRLLFAGYDDFICHVWDVLLRERIAIMPAHENRVSCVTISPNGVGVATGSWDNNCIIWTSK